MSDILEKYYKNFNNIVIRDSNGYPSIFVLHPKQKSNDFDASLPDHVHPAFKVDWPEGASESDIENNYCDDGLLIGKYINSQLSSESALYSLPNARPATSVEAQGFMGFENRIRNSGSNVSGMTITDLGLLSLIIQTRPDDWYKTEGACKFGCGGDCTYAYFTASGSTVNKGAFVTFQGYLYECLETHAKSNNLLPSKAPKYWRKIKKIGGTSTVLGKDMIYKSDPTYHNATVLTLTGSGPLNWYLFNDMDLESDLLGNAEEIIYGFKYDNRGRIFLMPNNLAANPTTNMALDSSAWRVIIPTDSNDNKYELVPLTEENKNNCLCFNIDSSNKQLSIVKGVPESVYYNDWSNSNLPLQVNLGGDPIPKIFYELGWLSLSNKQTPIVFNLRFYNTTSPDTTYNAVRIRKGVGTGIRHQILLMTCSYNLSNAASRSRARYLE